jgi:hypothetical protein
MYGIPSKLLSPWVELYASFPQGRHTHHAHWQSWKQEDPRCLHLCRPHVFPPTPPRRLCLCRVRFLIGRGFFPGTALLDKLLA